MLTIALPARARSSRPNRSSKYQIPNARRHSEVTRHRVTMMTKMSEPMAAQPRLLIKLPMMHGIVDHKIRNVSENHAARRSAGDLHVPKPREKEKKRRKNDDAHPNRRPYEVTWTRVVHPMELLQARYLMVDETMRQIFRERPKHRSTRRSDPPMQVQSRAAALDVKEQQSTDNDRIEKQLGVVTDLGIVLYDTQCQVPSKTFGSPADLQALNTARCVLELSGYRDISNC